MFCSQCGAQLNEGAKFCGKCGTPVQVSSAAADEQTAAYADSAAPRRTYADPAVAGGVVQQEGGELAFQSASNGATGWQAGYAQTAPQQGAAPSIAAQANTFCQVKELRDGINYLAARIEETKHSIVICDIATIVCAFLGVGFFGNVRGDSTAPVTIAVLGIVLAASIPYGLSAIRSFGRNHGYVIVFHWVFLVLALTILCWLCPFVAIPRALSMRKSVRKDKVLMEQFQLQLAGIVGA